MRKEEADHRRRGEAVRGSPEPRNVWGSYGGMLGAKPRIATCLPPERIEEPDIVIRRVEMDGCTRTAIRHPEGLNRALHSLFRKLLALHLKCPNSLRQYSLRSVLLRSKVA